MYVTEGLTCYVCVKVSEKVAEPHHIGSERERERGNSQQCKGSIKPGTRDGVGVVGGLYCTTL